MNPIYRDLILTRVNAAIGAARVVASVAHPGLKGQIREILIRDLFRPLLPSDFGVGFGEIISASGKQQSREQDIVIYNRRILPPIVFESSAGIFPVESVVYTIEVKSRLTAPELSAAHTSAKELGGFDYAPGARTPEGVVAHHAVEKVISTIIAFDSDLTQGGKSEIDRYEEIRGEDEPALRALCVIDRGYWFWADEQWHYRQSRYSLEEVVGFIAGVMNTYRRVSESRRQPDLGRYLV